MMLKLSVSALLTLANFGLVYFQHSNFLPPISVELALRGLHLSPWHLASAYLGVSFFFLLILCNSVEKIYAAYFKKEKYYRGTVRLPPWPDPADTIHVVVGEIHHPRTGQMVRNPTWLVIPEKGLYTNIFITGATGSGKTADVMYPLLNQLVGFQACNPDRKAGGLILDAKGDFITQTRGYLERHGRLDDLIVIDGSPAHTYNPLHYPELESSVLASKIKALLFNMGARSFESYWVDMGERLAHNVIEYLRLHSELVFGHPYVTFDGIYRVIISQDPSRLIENLKKEHHLHGSLLERFQFIEAFFWSEWQSLDRKIKSIVTSELTRIIGGFSEPKFKKVFCPRPENILFKGFNDIIDSGKIVALNMPLGMWGNIGRTISIMLKLDFQRAVLSRVSRVLKDPSTNTERPLFTMIDEFQEFVTIGHGLEGDDKFFDKSRQSKHVSIMATQSYTSLLNALGSKAGVETILQCFRNNVFLNTEDTYTAREAAEKCMMEEVVKESVSYSESSRDARIE